MKSKIAGFIDLKIFFLIILFSCSYFGYCQRKYKLDSVVKAYDHLTADTLRFENLAAQVSIYRLGEPVKAMEVSQRMFQLAERIGQESYKARAAFNLAIQYRKIANYDSAIFLYKKAVAGFEELKDESNLAGCYGSLGIACWQQKEYGPAIRYLKYSLAITQKLHKRMNECSNLNNIGGVFFDMKKYDSSLAYLHKALKISEEMRDTAGLADAYGNMGAVYILLKDTVNAVKYSLLGVRFSKLSGNNYQLFTSYNNIAQSMAISKNYKEAERYGLMAISLSEQLGALEGSRGAYKVMADIYKETGDFKKSNFYLEKFVAANDSLVSEARMKQMTDLEAKYQSARKDKELAEEKAASEKKNVILYALVAGFVLVAALAVFVYRGYRNKKKFLFEMTLAKKEIELKSTELELKNKDITDSINYARKIQGAVLPPEETIYKNLPSSFIIYKPKDIVSGDFFWFHEVDADNFVLVCGDCTGHGVPGALMTVVGINLLNKIVSDHRIFEPGAILSELDKLLYTTLRQDKQRGGVQDGMDISVANINRKTSQLTVATAKRPFVIIEAGNLKDYKGGKSSLGGLSGGDKVFPETSITYSSGDVLYFFTDGYADQFGGANGKKYSSKRLKETLYNLHSFPIEEQKTRLEKEISEWKGNLEQVDDICLIGIKF